MKTVKIKLESIKDSDGWIQLTHTLLFEKFKNDNKNLNEYELSDKFYLEVIEKKFRYGEYANIEIEVDEDFNIISGKIY